MTQHASRLPLPPAQPVRPDRLTLLAFSAAVLLGGTNFVAVRYSNRELDPLWGAGTRFVLAAAIFTGLLAAMAPPVPRGRATVLPVTYGLLAFGATYGLLYWGMQEVPAGVAAVILASGPLLTLLLAVAHGMEPLRARACVGAVVALLGSALMFLAPAEAHAGWLHLGAVCLAAMTAAESIIVAKRGRREHPVVMNALGMGAGGLALLAVSAASGEDWALPREPATLVALGYLVASSVVMFVLVLLVIQRWTASASSYLFVLMPPVAVGQGALIGGEQLAATTLVGALVVLVGVYVGALRTPRARGLR